MDALNLPTYGANVRRASGKLQIFDILRRRFITLTPEEWVRQHFVHYLIEHKGYPSGLLGNEIELRCGEKRLRCDSVLFDRECKARMIIEYKAPSVAITQKVFDQITTYNFLLRVEYLIVSNGMQHYCCQIDYEHNSYRFLTDIPNYEEIQRE